MQTALFVPCLAQEFLPRTALATAGLLQKAGFPAQPAPDHTCCGQPLYKTGRFSRARTAARHCLQAFAGAQRVVAPSASCVAMVRSYPELFANISESDAEMQRQAQEMASKTFELCEFLDTQAPELTFASFAGAAILHDSCQSRSLGVSHAVRRCLRRMPGLELLEPEDPAPCCGFGGSFSLEYPEISEAILEDRLEAIEALAHSSGARVLVTAEVSCLCNLQAGLKARKSPLLALHVAEFLAYGAPDHAPVGT